MPAAYDFTIIGGGIVGLSAAMALTNKFPRARIAVVEKEAELAAHQTGHNSGVIHSGIYYKPGSLKAKLCRAGAQSMVRFCNEHGLLYDVCGKIIVATNENEIPQLEILYRRGIESGIDVAMLSPEEVREREPHVVARKAIWVASTGICDYRAVALAYARSIESRGGEIRRSTRVLRVIERDRVHVLETDQGCIKTRFAINCAGLYSDRMARLFRVDPGAQIVPFRGEYYELVPERRSLVKNLIYPVPNPEFPFLGVHFTRMVDGSVHAGPNAVLGLAREAYRKSDIDGPDAFEILRYRGLWRLAAKHWREGGTEVWRSISKHAFASSLQRIIPELCEDDIVPTHAGVRAQALKPDGEMVDDFLFVDSPRALHVCNAPSPAATSSIEIGHVIATRVEEQVAKQF